MRNHIARRPVLTCECMSMFEIMYGRTLLPCGAYYQVHLHTAHWPLGSHTMYLCSTGGMLTASQRCTVLQSAADICRGQNSALVGCSLLHALAQVHAQAVLLLTWAMGLASLLSQR